MQTFATTPDTMRHLRVRVYRNTRTGSFSVQHLGRVVASVLFVYLDGATFGTRTGKSGARHAYVTGTLTVNSDNIKQVAISEYLGLGTRFTNPETGSQPRNTRPGVTTTITYA